MRKIDKHNRDSISVEYAELLVSDMDMDCLTSLAIQAILNELSELSLVKLTTVVKANYPEVLED